MALSKSFLEHFTILEDPRRETHRNKQHLLSDILVLTILGVICGAESWVDIENFGKAIQHAIRAAAQDNQNKAEQRDFTDWLCGNRKIIMGVFLDLSNICATFNEFDKATIINRELGVVSATMAFG